MAVLPAPPTIEQLRDLGAFMKRRERLSAAERMDTTPVPPGPTQALLRSWARLVDENQNRAREALRDGDLPAAALAWAVLLQAAYHWRDDPEFPESVRPLLLGVRE